MCSLAPDSNHCYQWTWVQGNNPDKCAKIKWTKFKDTWSNPPRDKCYLQIAINSWDFGVCKNIKWWMMSYTYQECVHDTAIKHEDAKWCKLLSAFPSELSDDDSRILNGWEINIRNGAHNIMLCKRNMQK